MKLDTKKLLEVYEKDWKWIVRVFGIMILVIILYAIRG